MSEACPAVSQVSCGISSVLQHPKFHVSSVSCSVSSFMSQLYFCSVSSVSCSVSSFTSQMCPAVSEVCPAVSSFMSQVCLHSCLRCVLGCLKCILQCLMQCLRFYVLSVSCGVSSFMSRVCPAVSVSCDVSSVSCDVSFVSCGVSSESCGVSGVSCSVSSVSCSVSCLKCVLWCLRWSCSVSSFMSQVCPAGDIVFRTPASPWCSPLWEDQQHYQTVQAELQQDGSIFPEHGGAQLILRCLHRCLHHQHLHHGHPVWPQHTLVAIYTLLTSVVSAHKNESKNCSGKSSNLSAEAI